ncbi:hypothetical protein acsn021_24190 [Anaerocolumna cellulosilytica]|uniref:Uncharacterized protein n=1 Tax=Anaerocolumna cellulosilytica TaxID=433286 RepID=A0A6S6R5X0_9FIRM|nr:fatty acid--CoA ligase family protein [Anaerocolumna cellulosilytica]MBB5193936.1 acyl-CoA synthetase (AMP-forming)/AMP-acid ligase II [Anaerocolumna cellulosilytica]BCJ94850.1 hypothetical protein acsn021_24190 [Anaerocolumna cellulosilytica]
MYNKSLPQVFKKSFNENSKKIAIEYGEQSITYHQLQSNIKQWSDEFCLKFQVRNPKVLLLIHDPVVFITIWLALWENNCIPIPLEGNLNSKELENAVNASRCNYIVSTLDLSLELENNLLTRQMSKINLSVNYYFIAKDEDNTLRDSALFFYTSGTTGLPKCVVFSHMAMAASVLSLAEVINLNNTDVFFTPLSPMLPATIATAVLPSLATGSKLVISMSALRGNILKVIKEKKVTIFFAVPYIYDLLSTSPNSYKDVWNNVRLCISSSAFLEPAIFDAFYENTGISIRSIYCSSEGGAITFNSLSNIEKNRNTVGTALPGVKIKILNDKMELANINEPGEIYVSGFQISSGYYMQKVLEKSVFVDNWVKSGDLGALDESNCLKIIGRISKTINISGHLVNPEEVEQVINAHPFVEDSLVYGIPDTNLGQRVAVNILLKDSAHKIDDNQLYEFCKEKLKSFKIPRYIEFVKEIPTSRYGKKVRK